jgi:hypothetical protein
MVKNSYTHKESEGEMGTKPPNQEDLWPTTASPVESLAAPRSSLAAAALNEARIVIARSRHASRAPRSVQALWYAQMQCNLHAWWISGGFGRDEKANAADENGLALDSDCAVD